MVRHTRRGKATRVVVAAVLLAGSAVPTTAQVGSKSPPPTATYRVYVGAESADLIHRIRFGPDGAEVEKTIPVGLYPTEMEGPHGLQISADGRWLHMTTGHGLPDGAYWRFELGPDTVVGQPTPLGNFPASLDVTPDGLYAFAVNFNLHGEMVPSDVSVIFTPDNLEVARIETCTMPHGARISPSGTHLYSVCMMDDQLVELDTRTFEVARRFSVAKGGEAPLAVGAAMDHGAHAGHGAMPPATCSPTWAQPAHDGEHIYVACNRSDEILEIAFDEWKVTRRFGSGRAPYNLATTADGRLLVATLKAGNAVEFFDLATGASLARTPTSTTVVHGVTLSPDSRYAFVSVEGVGAEPGKVDIFDLQTFERVADVEVGQQASGITFWNVEG
jgi:DNA-binding beta-propeller fold protein YncE